jgi:hypothetical protein
VRPQLYCAAIVLSGLCAAGALAQTAGRVQRSTIEENAKKLDVGASKQSPSGLGHVIAPNIVFAPTVTLESGYNTNPDEFFSDEEASPYGLANATGVFGFLHSAGATTLALRGTFQQYSDDIARSGRWDAGVAIDNAYTVAPNMLATFGAFYLRDEISLTASDNEGAYSQLAYKDSEFEAFVRVKGDQIGYLGEVTSATATPTELLLLQPSQFDMRRTETVSGFIFGPNARIGVYGELGGGLIDYTEQTLESILDRDADELWAVTGLRFNLHPTLVIDAGWRFNWREADDTSIDAEESNFFDGRLTWTPLAELQFVVEVDRRYSEPLSTLAIFSDKTHYGASAVYKPRPDLELSAGLRHDQIEQVGDVFDYHETEVSFAVAHQWSDSTTLYGLISNEHVEEQETGQSYDKLQVGAGTKIKF